MTVACAVMLLWCRNTSKNTWDKQLKLLDSDRVKLFTSGLYIASSKRNRAWRQLTFVIPYIHVCNIVRTNKISEVVSWDQADFFSRAQSEERSRAPGLIICLFLRKSSEAFRVSSRWFLHTGSRGLFVYFLQKFLNTGRVAELLYSSEGFYCRIGWNEDCCNGSQNKKPRRL